MVLMNENDTNISCDAKAQGRKGFAPLRLCVNTNISCDAKAQGCKRTVVFENLDAAQHGLGDKIILGVGDTGLLCR